MKEEKKIAVYYTKPIVAVGKVQPGSYVYDGDAELCYVDEEHHLHSYVIEKWASKDTPVFPITLETQRIMEKMTAVRNKWHKANIMNANFSRDLPRAGYQPEPRHEERGHGDGRHDDRLRRCQHQRHETGGRVRNDGAARAERSSLQLCRVATEFDRRSIQQRQRSRGISFNEHELHGLFSEHELSRIDTN